MAEPPGARYLDADGALELLTVAVEHAGSVLREAHLRSVHTRPGRSVSQVYEAVLRVEDREEAVLLVAHADTQPLPEGAFELERDGARVAVWRFPNDPFLPGLPSAIDPVRVRELLDELRAPAGRISLYTRAYRPSRRAVVEVTIATDDLVGRILYLKVLAGDRASELADIHRQLSPHIPVPQVIGVSLSQGIVALEALEGPTLRALLVEGGALPSPDHLVELSRRLAASGLRSRRDPRGFADPTRHVEPLCRLAPELEPDIARVAAEAARVDGAPVPVHGDLHDGQLLLRDGEVTGVLDVDGAGPGLIVQDAGNLIAHVQVVGDLWPQAATRCDDLAAGLQAAYREVVDAGDLARAIAGAWLGLATGPHRAQDADWPDATRHRIRRAVQALEAASRASRGP